MKCTKCKRPIEPKTPYHRTKLGPHHRDCMSAFAPAPLLACNFAVSLKQSRSFRWQKYTTLALEKGKVVKRVKKEKLGICGKPAVWNVLNPWGLTILLCEDCGLVCEHARGGYGDKWERILKAKTKLSDSRRAALTTAQKRYE